MLQLKNIAWQIGELTLFSEVNWTINPGKRVALIGPNGAGKTTLLRIITGRLSQTGGTILKPRKYQVGYLPQEELAAESGSVLSAALKEAGRVVEIEIELQQLHSQLENAGNKSRQDLLNKLGSLEHEFSLLGGYELEANAKKILGGLGFSESDFNRPLQELSGGWRMRVYLARLLLQQPDLLLLDEPTNHLDIESLEWLEDYLLTFPGSVVIVSHDRYFVDRLSNEIAELEFGKLTHYPGNFNFFIEQKALREEQLLQQAEEIRAEKARLKKFIDRFRYKATKAAQVQSRIKQYEKLQEIPLPKKQAEIHFKIECPVKSYHDVCRMDQVSFKYEKDWVLREVDFQIFRGEKIALVGPNGAGKTTLTKLLTGQLQPQIGKVVTGQKVVSGYYAQHQIDALNPENTVLAEVMESVASGNVENIRNVLGIFKFSGDDVDKQIRVLSGGEKARASLAKILLSPVNFLIMDEPTNHLDQKSKEALEKALKTYDGTALIISHDRYFLDRLVSRVFELKSGKMKQFEGNYTDYLLKKNQQSESASPEEQPAELKDNRETTRKNKLQKRMEAELRQSISRSRKEMEAQIQQTENEINLLEDEKNQLESKMSDSDFYKNETDSAKAGKRYQEINEQLPRLYQKWEVTNIQLQQLVESIKQD